MPTIEMTLGALVSGTWICTCTQGYFWTPKMGQNRNRSPGINRSAWNPASPLKAIGFPLESFLKDTFSVTRPTSVGPTEVIDRTSVNRTITTTTMMMMMTMASGPVVSLV